MNKQQRIDEILDMDTGGTWDKKSLGLLKAARVKELHEQMATQQDDEIPLDGDELESITGSRVREQYRKKYAEIASSQGRKAHTATGRTSLNNGDELALLLEQATPTQTCELADYCKGLPAGATRAKYTTDRIGQTHPKTGEPLKALNDGMVRMNAGNQIRSHCKKAEDTTVAMASMAEMLKSLMDAQADMAEEA